MMTQIKKSLGILLIAGIGGMTSLMIYKSTEKKSETAFQTAVPAYKVSMPEGGAAIADFTVAAEKTIPAVVHVKTSYAAQPANNFLFNPFNFWGNPGYGMPQQQQQASGSGVIISDDGYIVTNNHVVDNAEKIEVALDDKRTFTAKLIGADPSTDLALLKIDQTNLPYAKFSNSDDLKVGQWVLAVGNPFNLNSTATAGIVSAKGRNIHILNDQQFPIESFIQTDAAVNPGNSGGALVNLNGDLVGINAAIASNTGSYTGYSFAIPANIVRKVTKDLLEYGKVQRGFIGITLRDIDQTLAKDKNLKSLQGVYIDGVVSGGAGAAAGIKPGDVVTRVGEVAVNSASELQEQIGRFGPGDKVNLTVDRDGAEKNYQITLRDNTGSETVVRDNKTLNLMGAEFGEVSAKEKKQLGISNGVKITNLQSGKLRSAGIRDGFIITAIDNKKVYTADDVAEVFQNKSGGILIEGIYPNGMKAYYGFGL
ncbi:MAG TPA: Do family serine endopeptidase [Bacteroidia bacterium]|nr:MAG: putative periplasmic serine endoprotease DegP-like precursor [Bacteroidetes bacterium ADurb.Bin141]HNR48764.1 Do family serine endopeptidase [Bacteroidia bacterium]HNT82589.1 Do family serine endopeptidase [Bacteroidia bacterium]HRV52320.1 Do family serine endopeptidase [Bacteroidia bacterium]